MHRGAFTGAIKDRPGRFRTIERLGGTRAIPVNVRILAGTKHDLKQMVADGKFREDLYYRLNVLPLTLPSLRERREDIPELIETFLERFFRRKGEEMPTISEGVQQAFIQYDWPGNVRELENACERIAQLCVRGSVGIECVAASIVFGAGAQPIETLTPAALPTGATAPISLDGRLRDLEMSLIAWALKASRGNKSRAAALLQIKRSTLGDRIKHCGLDRAGGVMREAQAGAATAA